MVEKVPLMDSNALFSLAIENSVGRAVLVKLQNDAMPEMAVGALEALLDLDTRDRFSRSNLAVPPYHNMSTLLVDAVFFADVEQAVP